MKRILIRWPLMRARWSHGRVRLLLALALLGVWTGVLYLSSREDGPASLRGVPSSEAMPQTSLRSEVR